MGSRSCSASGSGSRWAITGALYNLFEPLVEVLRPIPGPAYLPILVLFVGIGHEMKVVLILRGVAVPDPAEHL